MFSKKINQLRSFLAIRKGDTEDLVTLISRLIHNTGLCSYLTLYKVHWVANVCAFSIVITFILQVIALIMAQGDPERLFECFSILAFCIIGVFKLISLRRSHQSWRQLLIQISILENRQLSRNYISDAEYESDNEKYNNFSYYINIYTNKFKNTKIMLTIIYSFTTIIFMMSPFVEYFLCNMRGQECPEYPHILPGWAPLDDLSIFGYLITVTCEFLASVYYVCVNVAFDLTVIGIIIFVCGQYSLLRDYSSRIGGRGKRYNFSKRRDDRAHYRIKCCHNTNLLLVNSITELDKLLSSIIGVYFFLATLTLCTVAIRLTVEEMGIVKLVSVIQYMCGTLIQLFLFCRYGDAVFNESSLGVGQGPFAAALWCLSPHVRRDLTMLGCYMMRPHYLHAGPFHYLNLPSFVQIVRAAYSYYAVLGKKE